MKKGKFLKVVLLKIPCFEVGHSVTLWCSRGNLVQHLGCSVRCASEGIWAR